MHYRGRFAPTPSGPLHLGSLVAALASYLDARAHGGQWLLRIEDVDQPRSVAGAAAQIREQLLQHGLQWDLEVTPQSQRTPHYQRALEHLQQQGLTYRCGCTRQLIKQQGGHWRSSCQPHPTGAIRLRHEQPQLQFTDGILGVCDLRAQLSCQEDFVLYRSDGWFTYQLAVVVDDIDQGITHVVRGADLVEATPWQLKLFALLGQPAPHYAHVPLVLDQQGRKLSKQNHAPALSRAEVAAQLRQAARYLQLALPDSRDITTLLQLAEQQWRARYLP